MALLLAACGPHMAWDARPVTGPDGTQNWVVVECRLRADCLASAGRACGRGYTITSDDGRAKNATMMVHCGAATPAD